MLRVSLGQQVSPTPTPSTPPTSSPYPFVAKLEAAAKHPLGRALTIGSLAAALTVAFGGTGCKVKPAYVAPLLIGSSLAIAFGLVGTKEDVVL